MNETNPESDNEETKVDNAEVDVAIADDAKESVTSNIATKNGQQFNKISISKTSHKSENKSETDIEIADTKMKIMRPKRNHKISSSVFCVTL